MITADLPPTERQKELETLLAVTTAASSSLSLDGMLTTALDRLVALVDASRAGVLLMDPKSGELIPSVLRPQTQISPDEMAELLAGSRQILAAGEPFYLPPDASRGYQEPGAFYPLRHREEVLGLLAIIGQKNSRFTASQRRLFGAISDQLAVAVANASLYAQAEEGAVAAERNRLARELHDAVTQSLFSASLIADVLPRIWEQDPQEGRVQLAQLQELTRGALAEMRTLLLELRPDRLLEESWSELLRQLVQAFNGRSPLSIDLTISGNRPLPPDVQIALYRLTQEALNNVLKHAGAERAWIACRLEPACVHLTVQDNGRGFDLTTVAPTSLGLSIMRERAAKIGATLQLTSQIGEGTRLEVVCPLTSVADGG